MKRLYHMTFKLMIGLLLILQMLALPVYAKSATVVRIEQAITSLSQNANSAGIRTGIAVYDLSTGEWIYQHDADKAFVPASNLKLYVTAAALDAFGPSYRFKTEIHTTGHITPKGVLQGNVILKGYGDPSLSEKDMRQIVTELKGKGITAVHGKLIIDESFFDNNRLGTGWMWDDEPYGYSAQISALAVHKNMITATLTPDKAIGQAPSLTLEPSNHYVTVKNNVTIVAGNDDNIQIERPRSTNTVILSGTLGKDAAPYQDDVTMEEPALFAGEIFKQTLTAEGISISDTAIEKTQVTSSVPIVTHYSQPLEAIITELNKESDNFYAEMLLKTLGATVKNKGSFDAGAGVIADFMTRAGVGTEYRQVDGSGLSRLDLISPHQVAQLLAYVEKQEYKDSFEKSLPIAGKDGTLKNRMKQTPAENNVHAKTGSMSGVHTLSGYVTAKNGDKLAFSIFLNGVRTSKPATQFEDTIAVLLSQYPDATETEEAAVPLAATMLSTVLNPILEQENMRGVTVGMVVGSLNRKKGEEILYERNANNLLTPASNMKLFTSTTALQELGPDYTFKTELYLSSLPDKNGTLHGDVILKGYGDPTLQSDDPSGMQNGTSIMKLVQALREKGVTCIAGNIIVDESQYDKKRLGTGWAWDDETYGYNAQLSALAINRGAVRVDYQPGARAGESVSFTLHPKTEYVQIINEAKTVPAGAENTFTIQRERGTNTIHLKGNLPLHASPDYERVAVEEPALYTGSVLKQAIEQSGIKVEKKSIVQAGETAIGSIKVAELYSPPLRDILTYANKNSDNFFIEMILKRLGVEKKGEGSTEAGIEVVQQNLQAHGIDSAFDMVDGSGLSRYNQISAHQVASVLEGIAHDPAFDVFYNSLPIAGVDGTLKSRMKQTPAENNVHAKTGTLQGVSALSGYVTTKNNEHLYFSILMNGYTASSKNFTDVQDQLAAALAGLSLAKNTAEK
jgi:D-alanyl-D-alanine carboxypeptidase/D-alanyl-D-alanine-endopeptidase (penicillin-binding protein 4)